MKIGELLSGIKNIDMVLPEFQREYVWNRDQAKKLMDSLIKGYPVGSLLFWKTDKPPELKNIDHLPEKLGTIEVILDGQQRLTTLYMLIENGIPPYYTPAEIETGDDPRNLYFHLETKEFLYYKPTIMNNDPLWLQVTDCFSDKRDEINVIAIAQKIAKSDSEALKLSQSYIANLTRLQSIVEIDLPLQTVPSTANLGDAITIFDLVNRQGTKLTDAELALTHMTGKWAHARRVMKEKIAELREKNFHFDLTFVVRALVGVVCHRALYDSVYEKTQDELIAGWERLSRVLDYLIAILPGHAHIHSNYDVNTNNLFIPLVVYLDVHGGKFKDEKSLKHAVHWLLAAHIQSRYSGQTDQKLEFDVSIIVQNEVPWGALLDAIIDQRGRIEVKPSEFEGRGARHPIYRMTYILAKSQNAVDWFNGAPLSNIHGKDNWIHSHHIFPVLQLYDSGYDSENHLHKKIVNEIANRAFLTAETNIDISNKLPKEYLAEVEKRFPGALAKQFIPIKPELWELDRFEDFLEERRNLIAMKINTFMESLISEPEIASELPIEEVIQKGESAILEFKSTLQWDVIQKQSNKGLQKSVLKTIVAFLNSQGGTLIIGVEDDGTIYGLDQDLKLVSNSEDKLLTTLASLYVDYIGAHYSPYINTLIEEIDGRKIAVIQVQKSRNPAYYAGATGSEFYIRVGPSSRMLDAESTVKYIEDNWDS